MKLLKSIILNIIVLISLFNVVVIASYKEPIEISARSACFIDSDTGMQLFSKDPHAKIAPASLAKIVTALVVFDKVSNLEEDVTVPSSIFDEFVGLNVSSVGIVKGEVVKVKDLLAAMMIASACEASSALAYYVCNGNIPAFVTLMNKKAKELGANNTHFVDAHGVSEDAYTTAYDMCLILREALKIPMLEKMAGMVTYELPATNMRAQTTIYTTNSMLLSSSRYYYNKIKGFKTGSMPDFKNFASYAVGGDAKVIGVVLGAPKKEDEFGIPENMAFLETRDILKWIFENFERRVILNKGELVNEVDVVASRKSDHVGVIASSDIYAMVPKEVKNEALSRKFSLPEVIDNDVKEGEKLGKVEFLLEDKLISSADLLAIQEIKTSRIYKGFYILKQHKSILLSVLVCFAVIVGYIYIARNNKY